MRSINIKSLFTKIAYFFLLTLSLKSYAMEAENIAGKWCMQDEMFDFKHEWTINSDGTFESLIIEKETGEQDLSTGKWSVKNGEITYVIYDNITNTWTRPYILDSENGLFTFYPFKNKPQTYEPCTFIGF